MGFSTNIELVNRLVSSVAQTAPPRWTKVAFYFEFLEDDEIGLRNKSTGMCYGGADYDVVLDDYDLGGSFEAIATREEFFHESVKSGDVWTGVLLVILNDGRFKIRFFYEDTPLLDSDDAVVDERISSGLKELP